MKQRLIAEGWEEIVPFEDDPSRRGLVSECEAPFIFEGEMTTKDDGSRVFEGLVQRANARNRNGRIYPFSILERETKKLAQLIKENGGILGELDHPETITINLQKTCQRLDHLNMKSDGIVESRLTMLPSLPMGGFAIGCADALKGKIGQSSRGGGTLFKKGADTMVGEDYSMKTYDVVHDPSTHGARPDPVAESLIREFIERGQHQPTHQPRGLAKAVDAFLGL